MKIKNTTNLPDERVEYLIKEACRGISSEDVEFEIRNSSKEYTTGHIDPWKWNHKVTVSLPSTPPCRITINRFGEDTLLYIGQSREAALVYVVAHEIFHLRQYRKGKRFYQHKCDEFAYKQLLRLELLEGEPKEVMSRNQFEAIKYEDLRKHGWKWDPEFRTYVSIEEEVKDG